MPTRSRVDVLNLLLRFGLTLELLPLDGKAQELANSAQRAITGNDMMIGIIICLLFALLCYALHRRRYVRFGMKMLGATVFLEAADHQPKNSAALEATIPRLQIDSAIGSCETPMAAAINSK